VVSSASQRIPWTDLLIEYERRGWIEIVEAQDTYGSTRMLARARITAAGRKRIDALVMEGVQPQDPERGSAAEREA
jgi:hypothetical protein